MQGKLYLCATPIGNLDDITLRVLNTLKEVDLIAAEDTRHSIKLLNHFDIKTPMTSYHEFNKVEKARVLVEKMKEGTNIALITDAGTPGISDPGEELVKQCYEAGIELTSLPGPAACITALTISGMATRRFAFEAFLPSDKKEKQRILEEGRAAEGGVLKVDSFLNHQMDISLLNAIGKEFSHRFAEEEITKLLTIEASGIGIAAITAQHFGNVPVVFAEKN